MDFSHNPEILTYGKPVMCSGFNLSVDFNLSVVALWEMMRGEVPRAWRGRCRRYSVAGDKKSFSLLHCNAQELWGDGI